MGETEVYVDRWDGRDDVATPETASSERDDEVEDRLPASRGPSRWSLERWRLRPKVAVVAVFPLIVALTLGSIRLSGEIREAVHLTGAAKHVDSLHALIATESAAAAVEGRAAAGTMVSTDLAALDTALSELNQVRREPGLPQRAAAAMADMYDAALQVHGASARSPVPLELMLQAQRTIATDADAAVESVLAPMNSIEVIEDKNWLLDLWAARRQVFAVGAALVVIIRNPSTPDSVLIEANGANAALLDRVGHYYRSDDARIASLHKGLTTEAPLLAQVRAALPDGPAAIRDVGFGDSLAKDQGIYDQLVDEAADTLATTVAARVSGSRSAAVRDVAVLLSTLLVGVVIASLVSIALLRPLRRLHDSARRVAEVELPEEVEQINADTADDVVFFTPVPVYSDEEIGRVARAVDDIHGQALHLAGQQRQLRLMVNDLFDALARRTKSLLDRQLQLIDALEENEKDPARLASLFQLDHLATRMRRNGDSLLVLAGKPRPRERRPAVSIGDILQAAASEVEQYQRVHIMPVSDAAVTGGAAVDIVHLVAELFDNALRASPPHSQVSVLCERTREGGIIIEIIDHGIGIGVADLEMLNERLSCTPEIEPDTARRMGLFVVGRLAEQHGVTVSLRSSVSGRIGSGITAVVILPPLLLRTIGQGSEPGSATAGRPLTR
ncbi:ATP-binding protein [Nocardia sp. NPDC006630]|uniref:ATP-binding protein n=1 Tax=Nocardia sp. NPDC006630 TaxID=3157181 RepID=UPI0033B1EC8A